VIDIERQRELAKRLIAIENVKGKLGNIGGELENRKVVVNLSVK
jgi:hypothetical protein